jgi:antitoxin component of MazEF toxin-antitoxin module
MLYVKARKQGGSVVITIPSGILKLCDIKAGDVLYLDLVPDGFAVRKASHRHRASFVKTLGPAITSEIVARTISVLDPAKA